MESGCSDDIPRIIFAKTCDVGGGRRRELKAVSFVGDPLLCLGGPDKRWPRRANTFFQSIGLFLLFFSFIIVIADSIELSSESDSTINQLIHFPEFNYCVTLSLQPLPHPTRTLTPTPH
jgi:hypothetical protein